MITKQKGLRSYLNMVYRTGDMTTEICGKRKTFTPAEIHEITYACDHELFTRGFTTTINPAIAFLYKDYGFIVEAEGIGWKVKRIK